jgi:quinol monooxygenase YgiN
MSKPLYITAIIECKPSRLEECLTMAMKKREKSLQEAGCLSFNVTQSNQDLHKVILLESYKDHASFEAHQGQSYMQEFGTLAENEFAQNIQFFMSLPVD